MSRSVEDVNSHSSLSKSEFHLPLSVQLLASPSLAFSDPHLSPSLITRSHSSPRLQPHFSPTCFSFLFILSHGFACCPLLSLQPKLPLPLPQLTEAPSLFAQVSERLRTLPATVPLLLQHILGTLEQEHGPDVLPQALATLQVTRSGQCLGGVGGRGSGVG